MIFKLTGCGRFKCYFLSRKKAEQPTTAAKLVFVPILLTSNPIVGSFLGLTQQRKERVFLVQFAWAPPQAPCSQPFELSGGDSI